MDAMTKEEIQELDLWRCKEAGRLSERDGFSEFWHYRTLVRDDVRPNPVSVFPDAVREVEKEIRYRLEETPTAEFLDRLPHLLATLYERGMADGLRPMSELTGQYRVNEPTTPERQEKFDELRGELKRGASVHPIRRHIDSLREREREANYRAFFGGKGCPEYPV